MKFAALTLSAILAMSVAGAQETKTETEAKPSSVLIMSLCNHVVGVIVTDSTGGLHPLPIQGWSIDQVKAVAASVAPGRTVRASLPCTGEVAT